MHPSTLTPSSASTHTASQPTHQYTGTQGRILELLGSGLGPEVVATAAGVSPSYISQLLSTQEFAEQVTTLRFNSLQAASARDKKYDELEDALIAKMQDLLPMMYKPHEVLRAIATINGAKRRGLPAQEQTTINNTIVNLTIPTQIIQKFTVDINNQVVEAGKQTLVTMPSSTLASKVRQQQPKELTSHEHTSALSSIQTSELEYLVTSGT